MKKMELRLKQVRGNTWTVTGPQLIPLYLTGDGRCILLDTGPIYVREALEELLERENLSVAGIIGTHTHFDHFGNGRYFQKKLGIPVALSIGEAETCRTYASIKSFLFAYPAGQVMADPKLEALACRADILVDVDGTSVDIAGVTFGVKRTPGHSPDHISIITPDNVCYAGDALLSAESLLRTKLPYAFNFAQSLESMESFRGCGYDAMIMAHAGIAEGSYDALVDDNISHMKRQIDYVCSLVDHPMSGGAICGRVKKEMNIRTDTTEKAQNLERFVRPYLECLIDEKRLNLILYDDSLCYAPPGFEGQEAS